MKQCPYCKTNNFDNTTYCENCGMPLKQGIRISCPKCGKLVREKDKYCKFCGTYLLEELKCPNCGNSILSTDAFCPECGESLKGKRRVVKSPQQDLNAAKPALMSDKEIDELSQGFDDNLEKVAESILNDGLHDESISAGDSLMDEEDIIDESSAIEEIMPEDAAVSQDITFVQEAHDDEAKINNYLMEGGSLMAEKRYSEAIKAFSKGIGIAIKKGFDQQEDKRLITLYIRRAEAFKKTDDSERAMDNYSRALKYAQSIFAVTEVEMIKNLIAEM